MTTRGSVHHNQTEFGFKRSAPVSFVPRIKNYKQSCIILVKVVFLFDIVINNKFKNITMLDTFERNVIVIRLIAIDLVLFFMYDS